MFFQQFHLLLFLSSNTISTSAHGNYSRRMQVPLYSFYKQQLLVYFLNCLSIHKCFIPNSKMYCHLWHEIELHECVGMQVCASMPSSVVSKCANSSTFNLPTASIGGFSPNSQSTLLLPLPQNKANEQASYLPAFPHNFYSFFSLQSVHECVKNNMLLIGSRVNSLCNRHCQYFLHVHSVPFQLPYQTRCK